MMRRLSIILGLWLTLAAAAAQAQQNQPLFATGLLTPGHALVLQQAGTPGSAVTRDGGPAIAGNFTELGVTNDGLPLCVRDKAGLHLLCFGANALGGGMISYNPIGSGAPLGFNFNINGTTFPFPGTGGGNVVGPTSPAPTAGDVALWNGGLTIKDGGPPATVGALAKCDGVTDDTAAIQAAINSLPTGGTVLLPAGKVCLTTGVTIGNGSALALSTQSGVILASAGVPGTSQFGIVGAAASATTLKLIGGSQTGIWIKGPLQGWGLRNLKIDCGSLSGTIGLHVQSGQNGDVANLVIENCVTGFLSDVVSAFPPGATNVDSLKNTYTNMYIVMPTAVSTGFTMTGLFVSGGFAANTDFNTFTDLTVQMPLTATAGAKGLVIGASDSNYFYNLHLFDCSTGETAFTFDYTINTGWPAGTMFFGIEPGGGCPAGTGFVNVGTPAAAPNWIYGLSQTNGAEPVMLANLFFGDSVNWFTYTPVVSCGTGTLTSSTVGGSYHLVGKTVTFTIVIAVTTNGSCAGSLNATLPFIVRPFTQPIAVTGFNAITGAGGSGLINSVVSTTLVKGSKYDGTYPVVDGDSFVMTGTYEAAP